jgi:hypothetical protein
VLYARILGVCSVHLKDYRYCARNATMKRQLKNVVNVQRQGKRQGRKRRRSVYNDLWQQYAPKCSCGGELFRLDEDESPYRMCINCGQYLFDFKPEEVHNGY